MFLLMLVLVGSLLHGYLFWHLAGFRVVRRHLALPAMLVWGGFAIGALYAHGAESVPAAVLEQVTVGWLVTLFLANVLLFGVDLITGFGWWAGKWRNGLRVVALLSALFFASTAMWIGHLPPQLSEHEVVLQGLPDKLDGKRVLFLSDLHLGSVQSVAWFEALVARKEALAPDMVVLGGDLFEGHGAIDDRVWPLLARLGAPLGLYAVTGNHEHHGNSEREIRISKAAGVIWLRNRLVRPVRGLLLGGVDDLSMHLRDEPDADSFGALLGQHEWREPLLLISHSPLQVERAAELGVDLMLSGHTHAGQVWPFGYLVRHFYPWFSGRYNLDGMTLLVSRGSGSWGVRMRLWQPTEMLLVTLRANPKV